MLKKEKINLFCSLPQSMYGMHEGGSPIGLKKHFTLKHYEGKLTQSFPTNVLLITVNTVITASFGCILLLSSNRETTS